MAFIYADQLLDEGSLTWGQCGINIYRQITVIVIRQNQK